MKFFDGKWLLSIKVLYVVVLVIVIKLIFHKAGFEIITINPLFTSIVAANTFLLGFILAGLMGDYKESERIPGELACSLESIIDESLNLYKSKKAVPAKECIIFSLDFIKSLKSWFYKEERTKAMLEKLCRFNDFFLQFEQFTQANFITRLKQEQSLIRRMITRVHTIRETAFLPAAHILLQLSSFILVGGFVLLKIEPFYESLFFVGLITFIFVYLIFLLGIIENPFDYNGKFKGVYSISLKPIEDTISRLEAEAKNLE